MTTQDNSNEIEKRDREIGRLSLKIEIVETLEKADWLTEAEKSKFKKFILNLE